MIDVSKHMDVTISHVHRLLCHPIQSDKQWDNSAWHYWLGHLSHASLQELIKQGRLPLHYKSCTPPICPACLFDKQTKRPWHHKGGSSHSLRDLAPQHPSGFIFADQLVSSKPGLIPQSTGSLIKCWFHAVTIFVDSFSDHTFVALQENLTMDATLDAKLDFEHHLSTHAIVVHGYHANNEPSLHRGNELWQPPDQLIEDPLFGPAFTSSQFQHFNLRQKALCILSFVALQLQHNEFMHHLGNGTANFSFSFAFLATVVDNDTYFYGQAMHQPDSAYFIQAMQKEVNDLFASDVWQLRCPSELGDIKLIKSTWSFKHKWAANRTITKYKAHLCAHGGMQVEGIHFWNTYSLIVQMITVCLSLVLSLLLGLKSISIDFTLAFMQAPIDMPTYLELPLFFSVDGDSKEYVLDQHLLSLVFF